MKVDPIRVSYKGENRIINDPHGRFYMWKEVCDRCGSVIEDHQFLHSNYPRKDESDYCIDCYRVLLIQKERRNQ